MDMLVLLCHIAFKLRTFIMEGDFIRNHLFEYMSSFTIYISDFHKSPYIKESTVPDVM